MGVDYRQKYIFFKDGEKHYCVMFKSSFLRGVHSVRIRDWNAGKEFGMVEESYPNLIERIKVRIAHLKARPKWFQR